MKIKFMMICFGFLVTITSMPACIHSTKYQIPYTLALHSASGGKTRLAVCRGKIAMLDFFTTWSQASMLSIPGYAALHRKYSREGLCIIGVALDEVQKTVEPFSLGMQLNYPIVLADESIRKGRSPFGRLDILPILMIFDHYGDLRQVVAGYVPLGELEKIIVPLLREMR